MLTRRPKVKPNQKLLVLAINNLISIKAMASRTNVMFNLVDTIRCCRRLLNCTSVVVNIFDLAVLEQSAVQTFLAIGGNVDHIVDPFDVPIDDNQSLKGTEDRFVFSLKNTLKISKVLVNNSEMTVPMDQLINGIVSFLISNPRFKTMVLPKTNTEMSSSGYEETTSGSDG